MVLTRLAVFRPLAVLMGLLGLVIMGAVSYTYLKVDRLPPITIPFVSVSITYTGASAQDVEQLIVEPVENAIAGMSGVVTMSSTSSEGQGTVSVQLADGTDIDAAALEVERRVAAIRNRMPTDAGDPRVNKADPNAQPIMNVALTGGQLDQLFDVANNDFLPQLQSVPGVASVNISGGLQREIQVQIDYAKMAAYGVTVTQIQNALVAANVTTPAGSLDQGNTKLSIRSLGNFQTLNDMANMVVVQATNGPILLRDVATVTQAYKLQTQYQRLNGQDAVGLQIVKQSDANALQVADAVRAELAKLKPLLPDNAQVVVTNDTSVFTRASLDAIQHDLLLSVLLVAGVMLLFLHAWRHTVIVLLAIPTSLVSTFLVMYALGFSLNIMSMMALALMIGILVDDSIVVLENIHRHLQLGEGPWSAALKGRGEIGMAAIAITAADVVVYLPIAFVTGVIGQLFRQYGLTIVAATLFSLLVSFTLTPMLASRWLKHEEDGTGPVARFGRWWDERFDRLARSVARSVPGAVRMRWLVIGIGLAMVVAVGATVPLGLIGTEYAPQEDDNNFSVNLQTPPGTSLAATDNAAREMEGILKQIPEVQYVFTNVTTGAGFGRASGGRANFAVQVVPKQQRIRSVFDIMNEVRAQARRIPSATVNADVQSPLGGGGGFGGGGLTSINMLISGPDLTTLNQVSSQIQAAISTVPGVTDVRSSTDVGQPELHVDLDRARMAQLGITSQQVGTALRTAVSGSVVSAFRPDGQTQLDITLVANSDQRLNLQNIASIPVGSTTATATGATGANGAGGAAASSSNVSVVTLGQIATLSRGVGPVQIQRVDRNRTTTLTATATDRSLGDVAKDVQATLNAQSLPAGYNVQIRGGVQQLNNSFAILGQALALSVVLEYMLLVALYESWFYPIVLILDVPFGIVGALLGLLITHNTLNIFSIIGIIMAVGLVTKTGILLVDYTNTLRRGGMSRVEALAEAARVRLRPILMTTCTMCFGMLPLALKLEPGAESRAPMAVVVIGGLLSSTLLAVFITPSLYTILDDLQSLVFRGRKPAEEIEEVLVPVHAPEPALAMAGANGHPVPHGSNGVTAGAHGGRSNGHGPDDHTTAGVGIEESGVRDRP